MLMTGTSSCFALVVKTNPKTLRIVPPKIQFVTRTSHERAVLLLTSTEKMGKGVCRFSRVDRAPLFPSLMTRSPVIDVPASTVIVPTVLLEPIIFNRIINNIVSYKGGVKQRLTPSHCVIANQFKSDIIKLDIHTTILDGND